MHRNLILTPIPDVVKLLLSCRTGKPPSTLINAVNDAGNTPLHWAALNGHLDSVKLLVESGADVTIINQAGHDAVFEAEINDKKEIVDWLLGAVEELENGIAGASEGSNPANADHDDNAGGKVNPVAEGARTPGGQEAASPVEDARKQMEAMDTKDSTRDQ